MTMDFADQITALAARASNMKIKVLLSLAIFPVLLSGCATRMSPQLTRTTSYTLGEAQEATVGARMIRVARAYELPAYRPLDDYNYQAYWPSRLNISLHPDQLWIATEEKDGGYTLRSDAAIFSVHVTPEGRILKGFIAPSVAAWTFPKELEGAAFERVEVALEGSFEAELIYSGRSGDTIRLVYREYFDGLAREAFYQELEYDLSESKSIAFKSLEIDVLEATNSRIRFLVREDGGLPWLPNR